MDAQLAAVIVQDCQRPLRDNILEALAQLVKERRLDDLKKLFRVVYILLDSVERQLSFQAAFAKRREHTVSAT
jgi:phage-related protein